MASNHKLTGIIKGRSITKTESKDSVLTLDFDDGSIMTVNIAAAPAIAELKSKIKSVRQQDTKLSLDFEDGTTLEITTTEATSSVMVRDKNHTMEYAD